LPRFGMICFGLNVCGIDRSIDLCRFFYFSSMGWVVASGNGLEALRGKRPPGVKGFAMLGAPRSLNLQDVSTQNLDKIFIDIVP
jgi:hypothetical protein